MPGRITSIIAGLSTFLILITFGILLTFGQIVLLNGASESQGFTALTVSIVCQSVVLLLAVILARWLSKFLVTKFNWNQWLAVVIAIIVPTGLGVLLAFLSVIIAIPLAGIK